MYSGNCRASEPQHQQGPRLNLIWKKVTPKNIYFYIFFTFEMWPCAKTPDIPETMKCSVLCREGGMLQSYEALCCKVTLLHSELKHQAGLIRRLRPLFNETRQGEAQKHS